MSGIGRVFNGIGAKLKGVGTKLKGIGTIIVSKLPPSFDGKLLAYFDGTNSSPTTKTELINGLDMTATQGPCLTLKVGDTMRLPMNDTPASNMGTAIFTYDGLDATVTTAGTIYKVMSTNGLEFPFCEGSGNTFGDTSSVYRGEIIAATPETMWTENTQNDYFRAMDKGYWTTDPDDGAQYPYDPSTTPYFNLNLTVTGLGTVTIDSTEYAAGSHTLEDLFGATAMVAAYGSGEDEIGWSGDTVTGTYPNFSIDMDGNKGVIGAFGASVSSLISNGNFSNGTADWTADGDLTFSVNENSQGVVTSADTQYLSLRQTTSETMLSGETIRVTFDQISFSGGSYQVKIGGQLSPLYSSSTNGPQSVDLTVTQDRTDIEFRINSTNRTLVIDNVVVVKL